MELVNISFPKGHMSQDDSTERAALATEEVTQSKSRFSVVGIGASAGGLQALQTFFEALGNDSGMAFVVVVHLDPHRESHMVEILQTKTPMPVSQVNGLVKVEPDHVYVIPPNKSIVMTDTHVDIREFTEPRGFRTPIDFFFRSLAKAHEDAIGMIFSGGGTDGAVGVKAIKERGGIILVQNPAEAEHDGMPQAAIATGAADLILPVSQLAAKLKEINRKPVSIPQNPEELSPEALKILKRILAQVNVQTGHDFSHYKMATVLRRIQRRMQLNEFTTLEDYLEYLQRNNSEAILMFNDLLISVTTFFRDSASWEALSEIVIPALLESKEASDKIRVWTVGCATGEEAYTIGMLFVECAEKLNVTPNIQIFASDLDEPALEQARVGVYPAAIEADVSPERLQRFFVKEGDHYRVRRELRDVVLFTNHSILRDPPFSRLDLIICRNLLIYLLRDIQEKVFEIFHYALAPGGYLFLGSAESVDSAPNLFRTLEKSHRIFQTKPWPGEHPNVPTMPMTIPDGRQALQVRGVTKFNTRIHQQAVSLADFHGEALEKFAPPSLLIDSTNRVIHFSETAGRYLLQPKGPITNDLLQLVRSELRFEMRRAISKAYETDKAVISPPVLVQFNGTHRQVLLSVRPFTVEKKQIETEEKNALIVFLEDEHDEVFEVTAVEKEHQRNDDLTNQLEREVRILNEKLQTSVEEYESSNEEMKASNEELQSINEEYRSATEELETSKEELQSVNEELQTVNSELKSKLDGITRANNDLENFMAATDVATLFLDRQLHIQRFTPGIESLYNIRLGDHGRPIADLNHKLKYDNLYKDAQTVLRQLIPIEREIQTQKNDWYLLRMRPYRTVDDHIDGVIITFVGINAIKKAQAKVQELNETMEQRIIERTRDLFYTLFHSNPIPTVLVNLKNNEFVDVNDAYLNFFNVHRDEVVGRSVQKLEDQLETTLFTDLVNQTLEKTKLQDFETKMIRSSGEVNHLIISSQRVSLEDLEGVITAFIDVTDRVKYEQQIRDLANRLTIASQEEQHRISQILHDDLQQRLYAAQIQMGLLWDVLEKGDRPTFLKEWGQIEQRLAATVKITRNLSLDLSPPILQTEGITEVFMWLADLMDSRYSLKVSVEVQTSIPALENSHRIFLFQAVREMLFNIVKHAGVLEAEIIMGVEDQNFFVTVKDEGDGFDFNGDLRVGASSLGLINIQQRSELLGYRFIVNSSKGNGCTLTIEMPLAELPQV